MASVSLQNVTKIYGTDTVALDDVTFDVDQGEFVVILGPSGAGKSTLLRILNGLTPPTEGTIEIGDERVGGKRDEVAMVFQLHYLVESMSAYRNALTGALGRTGWLRSVLTWYDESDKRGALDALDTVGLIDEAGQRAGSMSGGQKQRVGIARALVQEPELLLADEPVSSLDPKAARDVMGYMKTAAMERNLTTVASLHQVNIAREFGDRFIGIRDGSVVFDGGPDELTMDVIDDLYYGGDASEAGPAEAISGSPDSESELAPETSDTGVQA
ncbi:MAG TPA: phosphonate ABC transporter ATP-binding protein [Natrialbaceae archaeon]|nr:phosphonate ABC transporter ATP-binding protein [Natrialbaceae archaeon]